MEHLDRTDEEREELVRKFIKDYWLVGVIAVVGAIAALYGLNYYKTSKISALSESAQGLTDIDKNITDKKLTDALSQTELLQSSDKDSSFPVLATFKLAKNYFDNQSYDKAIKQYDWLISHVSDKAVRDIARLRKARAQANLNQATAAIDTLSGLETKQGNMASALLKGDIYMADKQFDAAKKAYESIKLSEDINSQLVEQRLNLLAIKQQKTQ